MRDTAFLLTKGVSYADALRLSPVRRRALCVAIGEIMGEEYDWERREWKERRK